MFLGEIMKRRVYVYQENLSSELIELFNSFGDQIAVESVKHNLMTIIDNDYYNPEPIDVSAFQELIQEDFGGEVIIFVEPYMVEPFVLGDLIKEFIPSLPFGVFFFDDIITYAVLKQNTKLKDAIRIHLLDVSNPEVIHTVREFIENNMNSSLSAKKLYMHRNTLNYRIDNFIEATHINVKTFKGANAIYMLYKF
jgi:hypothetical protein